MKRLITISEESFGRAIPDKNIKFLKRQAARSVLINSKGQIYLLHVTSQGYHKLPGGGIDNDEGVTDALKREIAEEVGCNAEVGEAIGEVLEYRAYEDDNLEQYSYCYIARQVGELGKQNLEQGEIDEGHNLVVATDIDNAIAILENDTPKNKEGWYIRLRDLTVLKEARKILS